MSLEKLSFDDCRELISLIRIEVRRFRNARDKEHMALALNIAEDAIFSRLNELSEPIADNTTRQFESLSDARKKK